MKIIEEALTKLWKALESIKNNQQGIERMKEGIGKHRKA